MNIILPLSFALTLFFLIKNKPQKYLWSVSALMYPVITGIAYIITKYKFRKIEKKVSIYWCSFLTLFVLWGIAIRIAAKYIFGNIIIK